MQRRRALAALAMTATTLAACNALLSLDGDYRLATDGGVASDGGDQIAPPVDGGSDATLDVAPEACWANPRLVKNEWLDMANWPVPNPSRAVGVSNPASYDASVPGLVYDNVTRLTWLLDDAGSGFDLYDAGLTTCASRGARLPTRMELVSLQAWKNAPDAGGADPVFTDTLDGYYYWTSTPSAGNPLFRWIVVFHGLGFGAGDEANTVDQQYAFRCVHGPTPAPALPAHRYELSETCGVVRDVRTKLEWERGPGKEGKYTQAEAHCESLRKMGRNPWRIPTYGELYSLVYTKEKTPAIDEEVFTSTSASYWTSSLVSGDPDDRITIRFDDGIGTEVSNEAVPTVWVRCVRDMD